MKIRTFVCICVLVGICVCGGAFLWGCAPVEEPPSDTFPKSDAKTIDVTMETACEAQGVDPAGMPEVFTVVKLEVPEGSTVFDVLNASGWAFEAQDSAYGKYVTGLRGLAGSASTGWVFEVNHSAVMEGADACVVCAGDVITWKYISW